MSMSSNLLNHDETYGINKNSETQFVRQEVCLIVCHRLRVKVARKSARRWRNEKLLGL